MKRDMSFWAKTDVTAARSIKVVINNFDITKIGLALLISALSHALFFFVLFHEGPQRRGSAETNT